MIHGASRGPIRPHATAATALVLRTVVLAAVLLCVTCASSLAAQTIDEDSSRFLSSPHGRTGCYSPYELVVDTGGADTITVESVADGVVLEKQVATGGRDRVEVVIPVMVAEGTTVRVGEASLQPVLPIRRVAPDYARPYTAVFSPDPVGARAVLPSMRERVVCDYFDLSEFFTDWRLLDAYDALVIFNPNDSRLPPGSQRAIAEFCSLGGTVFIGGSFRFGEKVVDLPATVGPEVTSFRGTPVRRFGYGPGAIYRTSWGDLTRAQPARLVVSDALRDHYWFGGDRAPGGEPDSRIAPQRSPVATPLPTKEARPTPLFYGLAGGLVLLCLVSPIVISRVVKRRWVAHLCVSAGALAIGAGALIQDRPLPVVELSAVYRTGEGDASSAFVFRAAEEAIGENMRVKMSNTRVLPKSLPARPGWNAWMVIEPLAGAVADRAGASEMAYGRVGEESFRDFSTQSHRGDTQFSAADAWLVEWWLDRNAYRGRFAELAPAKREASDESGAGVRVINRGAIRVTNGRR